MHEHELSPVPREARALQGRRAGVVTRTLAAGVDAAVVAVTLLSLYLGYAGVLFLLDPRSFSFPDTQLFRSLLVAATRRPRRRPRPRAAPSAGCRRCAH